MRIEFRLEPHFARQIGVSEVNGDRAPDREIDGAVDLWRHRQHDGDRQRKRIAIGERSVNADKGRTQA